MDLAEDEPDYESFADRYNVVKVDEALRRRDAIARQDREIERCNKKLASLQDQRYMSTRGQYGVSQPHSLPELQSRDYLRINERNQTDQYPRNLDTRTAPRLRMLEYSRAGEDNHGQERHHTTNGMQPPVRQLEYPMNSFLLDTQTEAHARQLDGYSLDGLLDNTQCIAELETAAQQDERKSYDQLPFNVPTDVREIKHPYHCSLLTCSYSRF